MKKIIKNNSLVVGVDIGGSHISAALVDLKRKCILLSTHIVRYVNSHGTVEEIMKAWADTIQEVLNFHPQKTAHIGIAIPGPFDYEQGICYMANVNKYNASNLLFFNVLCIIFGRFALIDTAYFMAFLGSVNDSKK